MFTCSIARGFSIYLPDELNCHGGRWMFDQGETLPLPDSCQGPTSAESVGENFCPRDTVTELQLVGVSAQSQCPDCELSLCDAVRCVPDWRLLGSGLAEVKVISESQRRPCG
jgi:hypothetical protein